MIKKIATLITAAIVVVLAFGVAGAAATVSAAPVKAYGACVNKVKKTWRPLQADNLAKSRYGKCANGETKILLPSVDGVPAKGAKGDTGLAGPKGDVGATGPKGDTGPAGVKGDVGPAGTNGKDGRGFDGAPFNMTFTGNGPWSCSWVKATETLACVSK